MDQNAKKNTMQIGLLVVLLAALGFLMFNMISKMSKPQNNNNQRRNAAARKNAETDRPSSTNMPVVARSGDSGSGEGTAIAEGDLRINPNQFKVYALNPPKNPFVQKEGWYDEQLDAALPGYPELESSDYFESPDVFLPDMALLNTEEWEEITVDRAVESESYQISGTSQDGNIKTTIKLTPKGETGGNLAWSPATGIPFSALKSRDVLAKYGDRLNSQAVTAASREAEEETSFLEDILGIPGGSSEASTDEVTDGTNGAGNGDEVFAIGVSRHGRRASALMQHNGKTHIVKVGSVIPTHFQVLDIKDDGVLLMDLRDGSSKWVPLGAAPPPAKGGNKERARGSARQG